LGAGGGGQAAANSRDGRPKPEDDSPDGHYEPKREFSVLAEFCGVKIEGVGWPAPHFAPSGGKKDEWWLRIVGLNGPADDVRLEEVARECWCHDSGNDSGFINLQSTLESTFLRACACRRQTPMHPPGVSSPPCLITDSPHVHSPTGLIASANFLDATG
jgi:hypothetical protein